LNVSRPGESTVSILKNSLFDAAFVISSQAGRAMNSLLPKKFDLSLVRLALGVGEIKQQGSEKEMSP